MTCVQWYLEIEGVWQIPAHKKFISEVANNRGVNFSRTFVSKCLTHELQKPRVVLTVKPLVGLWFRLPHWSQSSFARKPPSAILEWIEFKYRDRKKQNDVVREVALKATSSEFQTSMKYAFSYNPCTSKVGIDQKCGFMYWCQYNFELHIWGVKIHI